MKRQLILVLAMVVVMLWAGSVFANLADGLIASEEQGWPQWRGPRRDGISDEKGRLYLRYHDTPWCYDVKER